MPEARLITIALSHYCEKARWALDHAGVAYREEAHAPVAHRRATRSVGARSVPVLVDGGVVLKDSTDIAHHASRLAPEGKKLVPDEPSARARVTALEDELDEALGVDTRLLVYWYNLGDPERAPRLFAKMSGLRSKLALAVATPLFRRLIFRMYGVDRASAARAEARVRATFDAMSARLASSPYLAGDRFTLADLTFASLGSLVLPPPEHPVMGRVKEPPAVALAALGKDLAATAAGQHLLRMYREHRRPLPSCPLPSCPLPSCPLPS